MLKYCNVFNTLLLRWCHACIYHRYYNLVSLHKMQLLLNHICVHPSPREAKLAFLLGYNWEHSNITLLSYEHLQSKVSTKCWQVTSCELCTLQQRATVDTSSFEASFHPTEQCWHGSTYVAQKATVQPHYQSSCCVLNHLPRVSFCSFFTTYTRADLCKVG